MEQIDARPGWKTMRRIRSEGRARRLLDCGRGSCGLRHCRTADSCRSDLNAENQETARHDRSQISPRARRRAAVVQLYADGFGALPLERQDSAAGTSIWPPWPGATSITTSATPTTSRCGRSSRRFSRTPTASIRRRSTRSGATRSCSGSTPVRTTASPRASSCLRATPARVRRRGARAAATAARVPAAPGERSTQLLDAAARRCSSTRLRADGDEQDAGRRPRHPRGERQQPLRRRLDDGPRRLRRALRAQLAPGERRTAELVEEVYRVGGKIRPRDSPHRRSPRGRDRLCAARRRPTRCAR